MSLPAESAIRAWVNGQGGLVGPDNPLALGAYLSQQRSPGSGSYAVLSRQSQLARSPVAEDESIDNARISFLVYGGTEEAAEAAAVALANSIGGLTGRPEVCGDTGITVLVHDNLSGPMFVPMPASGGEQFAFEVAADFLLAAQ
jgi:hypothetical protein